MDGREKYEKAVSVRNCAYALRGRRVHGAESGSPEFVPQLTGQ